MNTFNEEKKEIAFKDYLIELIGKKETTELLSAIKRKQPIIITGTQGPTGKSFLVKVLKARNVNVVELCFAHTVNLTAPINMDKDLLPIDVIQ